MGWFYCTRAPLEIPNRLWRWSLEIPVHIESWPWTSQPEAHCICSPEGSRRNRRDTFWPLKPDNAWVPVPPASSPGSFRKLPRLPVWFPEPCHQIACTPLPHAHWTCWNKKKWPCWPTILTLLSKETSNLCWHDWQLHDALRSDGSVVRTGPKVHFGHLRALKYEPHSVGSSHLNQSKKERKKRDFTESLRVWNG